MTRQLDVKPRHREQIERLLRGHLPGVEVGPTAAASTAEATKAATLT